MRLLHIIASMDPLTGGPCQVIRNLNPTLANRGINTEVVSLDDPESEFIGSDPFVIHPLGPGKTAWKYGPKLLPWLIKNLARYDFVIINGLWQYHAHATTKALSHLRRVKIQPATKQAILPKVFIMPHGMLDPYFQKAKGRRLKACRNWIYWKLLEQKTINIADGVLVNCEQELILARQAFQPYHPKQEFNIGNGIQEPPPHSDSMDKAFMTCCPQLINHSYLLFLSRIHVKKGVDLLLQAYLKIISIYKKEGKENGFPKLVIAGPGIDTAYGKSIITLIKSNNLLMENVLLPGMLTGDAKWGAFYRCDAFILPSHQENFGIAVVEAMACSKPVLISNQVNIWPEIKNGGGGLVEHDTIKDTEKLLFDFMQLSSINKCQMGVNARNTYEKCFSIDSTTERLIKILLIK